MAFLFALFIVALSGLGSKYPNGLWALATATASFHDAQRKYAPKFQVFLTANQFNCATGLCRQSLKRISPSCRFRDLGGSAMIEDDFPHNVALWLGLAFTFAVSLFTAFAFGGFPLP